MRSRPRVDQRNGQNFRELPGQDLHANPRVSRSDAAPAVIVNGAHARDRRANSEGNLRHNGKARSMVACARPPVLPCNLSNICILRWKKSCNGNRVPPQFYARLHGVYDLLHKGKRRRPTRALLEIN